MAFITLMEIIEILIVTGVLGYIFADYIKKPKTETDLLYGKEGFSWANFRFAVYVVGPAIILHELGHKFVAMGLGLVATFKAWYFGLGLGLFLHIISSPFILFAPGYVEIYGGNTFTTMISAFAGPLINIILWSIATLILSRKRKLTQTEARFWYLTKQVNLFLFIFNMLPIPPLDGSKVFFGLFKLLTGTA